MLLLSIILLLMLTGNIRGKVSTLENIALKEARKTLKGMVKFCEVNRMSSRIRKPTMWVSDQVRHKPACAVTEADLKLQISDLYRRKIVLSEW